MDGACDFISAIRVITFTIGTGHLQVLKYVFTFCRLMKYMTVIIVAEWALPVPDLNLLPLPTMLV